MNKKIKILIENSVPYLSNNSNEISSTNVYLFNIIKNLSENYNDIEIIILTNWNLYIEKFNKFNNVKVIYSKVRNPLIWLNFIVPYYWIKNKVDVIFYGKSATSIFPIPWINIVSTIHWLIYKIMPETSSKIENIYWRLMAKIAYLVSKKIIVVSNNDFNDLVDDGCNKSKLEKIYIWLDEKYFYDKNINIEYLKEFNLQPKEYFIQIWWISKKKNQKFTLDIFKKIFDTNKNFKLVFVWPVLDKEYYNYLQEIINENNLQNNIIFTFWINQNIEFEKFITLLQNAKIFYFPSIYEWFWIPPLEAISQKVPALISNKGSLNEIYWIQNTFDLNLDLWIKQSLNIINNKDEEKNIINNQSLILEKYKWKNIIKNYYNLFNNYKR